MEEERYCENCRFAAIYDGMSVLGCLKDGSMVYPSDTCDKHRFLPGQGGGRPRKRKNEK
jgi:hypothetical protein